MSSLSYVDEQANQMAYEKPCVYFTTSNLVDKEGVIEESLSLRMTTLPKGYTDEDSAKQLFEEILVLEKYLRLALLRKISLTVA